MGVSDVCAMCTELSFLHVLVECLNDSDDDDGDGDDEMGDNFPLQIHFVWMTTI